MAIKVTALANILFTTAGTADEMMARLLDVTQM